MKAQRTDLQELWQHSAALEELPGAEGLEAFLRQPLRFRVPVEDAGVAHRLFAPDAVLLQCTMLSSLVNVFTMMCDAGVQANASELVWQKFYDILLQIPTQLCLAQGRQVVLQRNSTDPGVTVGRMRPDVVFSCDGLELLRGEEKRSLVDIPLDDLERKMAPWKPFFFGDLDYILGYATSGAIFSVVSIQKGVNNNNIIQIDNVLKIDSILTDKAEVIKVFFNLAVLFDRMVTASKRALPGPALPYDNGRCRLILTEDLNAIQRTIRCADEEDLEMKWNIYQRLQQLNRIGHPEEIHLQVVESLDQDGLDITVQLSPLGYHREPRTAAEVRTWLKDILTALELWHAHNYCHGDVCWENIVYVPGAEGYWVLIDLDKSTPIDHDHLAQADLVQLSRLLNGLLQREDVAEAGDPQLPKLQMALHRAHNLGLTAAVVLTHMAQEDMQRSIHCRDEEALERTLKIYQRLQLLNHSGCPEEMHLQRVERLNQDGLDITMHLSPSGYHRKPRTAAEVRTWLKNMLTALRFWHSYNYCHGDVCWENIVYVPGAEGYWVLTSLDGSSRIDCDHPAQTDLVQLSILLNGLLQREVADLQLRNLQQALHGARLTGLTALTALQDTLNI